MGEGRGAMESRGDKWARGHGDMREVGAAPRAALVESRVGVGMR